MRLLQAATNTGWDFADASWGGGTHGGVNFGAVPANSNRPGIAFKSDGTKMYRSFGSLVYEYSLGTAWKQSTATFTQSKTLSGTAGTLYGMAFKSDGTKLYVLASPPSSDPYLEEYSLGSAWDVSTAGTRAAYLDLSAQITKAADLVFKPDGTLFWVTDDKDSTVSNSEIFEYTLGSAWETISTASAGNSVTMGACCMDGITANVAGTRMYVLSSTGSNRYLAQHTLTSGWDLSTVNTSSSGTTYSMNQDNSITTYSGLGMKTDDTVVFTATSKNNSLESKYNGGGWSLKMTSASDITTMSFDSPSSKYIAPLPSMSGNDVELTGPFFKGDGSKMYLGSQSGDGFSYTGGYLYEFNLGTAWDSSTASSLVTTKDLTAQGAYMKSLFFRSDGLKLFTLASSASGGGTRGVFEYDLSGAWDASTATYNSNTKDLSSEFYYIYGFWFKPDGTKMYVSGATVSGANDTRLSEYDLSSAWDVSTASLNQTVDTSDSSHKVNAGYISFKPTGKIMYRMNFADISQFNLTTAWDISTISSTASTSYLLETPYEYERGFYIRPSGKSFYVSARGAGNDGDRAVWQYGL